MPTSTPLPPESASLDVPSRSLCARPILSRQRLDELERILERRVARQRQEQHDQTARLRALLDEGAK